MEWVFTIFTIAYASLLTAFMIAWSKGQLSAISPDEVPEKPLVSVIIAVRNESHNILNLLHYIKAQTYTDLEVVIVDDHSTDNTVERVQNYQSTDSLALRLLQLADQPDTQLANKKGALNLGIRQATGKYIITTDADCCPGPGWVKNMVRFMQQHGSMMVCGPVTFDPSISFFEKLQTIEFASLIGSGAASLRLGFPNMANGANLAFTKQAFEQVGGYEGFEHLPSGDDEFLLHKVYKAYPDRVHFIQERSAVVPTVPQASMSAFIQQRKRWASKWKQHKDRRVGLLAVFIACYHLVLLLSVGLVVTGSFSIRWLAILLLVRLLVETLFLSQVLKFLGKRLWLVAFLCWQLLYPFYLVFFGVAANFGSYQWKSRTFR
ncbi:MAG: glycosyltransferase [Cyclobacteriaceae bacterium]